MWSFLKQQQKKREKKGEPKASPKPMEFPELVSTMGDLSDLARNDVALKFWLPEPAEKALEEVCIRSKDSLSSGLRLFFILHCYGLYAFHVMQDLRPGFWKDPQVLYSVSQANPDSLPKTTMKKRIPTYWVVELGKNIAPIKVWVPKRVKNDLSILANHVGLTTSNYVREIVISRLLGHGMLPKRPEMFNAEPLPDADNWAEDRELTWKRVPTIKEFRQYKVREERWPD
jgi:hypothetical protein